MDRIMSLRGYSKYKDMYVPVNRFFNVLKKDNQTLKLKIVGIEKDIHNLQQDYNEFKKIHKKDTQRIYIILIILMLILNYNMKESIMENIEWFKSIKFFDDYYEIYVIEWFKSIKNFDDYYEMYVKESIMENIEWFKSIKEAIVYTYRNVTYTG